MVLSGHVPVSKASEGVELNGVCLPFVCSWSMIRVGYVVWGVPVVNVVKIWRLYKYRMFTVKWEDVPPRRM